VEEGDDCLEFHPPKSELARRAAKAKKAPVKKSAKKAAKKTASRKKKSEGPE